MFCFSKDILDAVMDSISKEYVNLNKYVYLNGLMTVLSVFHPNWTTKDEKTQLHLLDSSAYNI